MKYKMKTVLLTIAFSLCMSSATACSFVDKLKGTEEEDAEVDKDEKYNGWKAGEILSLDGLEIETGMKSEDGHILVKFGRLARKGFDFLSIHGNEKEFYMCSVQGKYYVRDYNGGWFFAESLDSGDKRNVEMVKNSLSGNLGDGIEVISSQYKKTEEEGKGEVDVIQMEVPDKTAQEIIEAEKLKEMRVKDEAEYGNGLAVIIDDGKEEESEEISMPMRVFLDAETEEIKKIQYKSNGIVTELLMKELKYALPDGMDKAQELDSSAWAEKFTALLADIS